MNKRLANGLASLPILSVSRAEFCGLQVEKNSVVHGGCVHIRKKKTKTKACGRKPTAALLRSQAMANRGFLFQKINFKAHVTGEESVGHFSCLFLFVIQAFAKSYEASPRA